MSSGALRENREQLLPAGTVLDGRYEVLSLIGVGGFAEVYAARQTNIGREVAVKVLDLAVGTRRGQIVRDRFLQEAQVVAQLSHPGIVTIFDYGIYAESLPYIVLERLDGVTVFEHIVDVGTFSLGRATALLLQGLEALAVAHEHGVVHRDIKPSNLFVLEPGTRSERICMLDFGLAFLTQGEQGRLTQTGLINGTPRYLAPEYIQFKVLTPALDVYQMALVFVEMLTGRPAVDDDNPFRCFMKHCSGELDIPTELFQTTLSDVLQRALHIDHNVRYPHAAAFRDALVEVLDAHDGVLPEGQITLQAAEVRPQATFLGFAAGEAAEAKMAELAAQQSEGRSARPPTQVFEWDADESIGRLADEWNAGSSGLQIDWDELFSIFSEGDDEPISSVDVSEDATFTTAPTADGLDALAAALDIGKSTADLPTQAYSEEEITANLEVAQEPDVSAELPLGRELPTTPSAEPLLRKRTNISLKSTPRQPIAPLEPSTSDSAADAGLPKRRSPALTEKRLPNMAVMKRRRPRSSDQEKEDTPTAESAPDSASPAPTDESDAKEDQPGLGLPRPPSGYGAKPSAASPSPGLSLPRPPAERKNGPQHAPSKPKGGLTLKKRTTRWSPPGRGTPAKPAEDKADTSSEATVLPSSVKEPSTPPAKAETFSSPVAAAKIMSRRNDGAPPIPRVASTRPSSGIVDSSKEATTTRDDPTEPPLQRVGSVKREPAPSAPDLFTMVATSEVEARSGAGEGGGAYNLTGEEVDASNDAEADIEVEEPELEQPDIEPVPIVEEVEEVVRRHPALRGESSQDLSLPPELTSGPRKVAPPVHSALPPQRRDRTMTIIIAVVVVAALIVGTLGGLWVAGLL